LPTPWNRWPTYSVPSSFGARGGGGGTADRDHPYGHGKAEAIAAAVVSTLLLLAALGIAVQAGRQLGRQFFPPFQPREAPAPSRFSF